MYDGVKIEENFSATTIYEALWTQLLLCHRTSLTYVQDDKST